VVVSSEEHQESDDHGAARDVPPDAEVVEPRGQADAEDVDEDLGDHEDDHDRELEVPARRRAEERNRGVGRSAGDAGRGADEVRGCRHVDPGGDRDLADHVEPRRDPRPRPAAEPERPEVEPPAVGYAEASSAIEAATHSVKRLTTGQPTELMTGPASFRP